MRSWQGPSARPLFDEGAAGEPEEDVLERAASDEDLFTPRLFSWLEEETLATAVEWDSTKHYPEHLPHLTA